MDGFFTCIVRCQKACDVIHCGNMTASPHFRSNIHSPLFPMERCKKSSCLANCQTVTCLTVMETWSSVYRKMYEELLSSHGRSGIWSKSPWTRLKAMSHDARFSVLECDFRNTQEIQHPILNWLFHSVLAAYRKHVAGHTHMQKLRHETRVKNPKKQISYPKHPKAVNICSSVRSQLFKQF